MSCSMYLAQCQGHGVCIGENEDGGEAHVYSEPGALFRIEHS
jgi:hypothetical protein